MNRQLKNVALSSFRSAGVFRLMGRSHRRKERLLILCYHGISVKDEHRWRPALYLTRDAFQRRLELLRDFKANVLPLSEAVVRLCSGTLPERSVVLTFDDGFADFATQAFPLLQQFEYPSTVYLTTFYCDRNVPVFNLVISYMLARASAKRIDMSDFGGSREPVAIETDEQRETVARGLQLWVRSQRLNWCDRDCVARAIACRLGVDYEALLASRMLQIMSSREAAALSHAGVTIEMHTHRHRTPDDRELFTREIRDNRLRILDITGRDPTHFCYPSGDCAPHFLPWLRDCGVESATTCEPGLARRNTEPLLLPRMLDHEETGDATFESWLGGFVLGQTRQRTNVDAFSADQGYWSPLPWSF